MNIRSLVILYNAIIAIVITFVIIFLFQVDSAVLAFATGLTTFS